MGIQDRCLRLFLATIVLLSLFACSSCRTSVGGEVESRNGGGSLERGGIEFLKAGEYTVEELLRIHAGSDAPSIIDSKNARHRKIALSQLQVDLINSEITNRPKFLYMVQVLAGWWAECKVEMLSNGEYLISS